MAYTRAQFCAYLAILPFSTTIGCQGDESGFGGFAMTADDEAAGESSDTDTGSESDTSGTDTSETAASETGTDTSGETGDEEPQPEPCVPFEPAPPDSWSSALAQPGPDGYLVYASDGEGNRIPSFGAAGYRRGEAPLPEVETILALEPSGRDDTAIIQAALDEVGQLDKNAQGHRGAVELAPGVYEIAGTLKIDRSGVVLRGAGRGSDPATSTILRATGDVPHQRDVIIAGNGSDNHWSPEIADSRSDVISEHVPVGATSLDVAEPEKYAVGNHVVIVHPCTAQWLEAVDHGGTAGDPGWAPGELPIVYKRQIVGIEGATLHLDAPVFNHLDRSVSQSYVYRQSRSGIVTEVGIENLRIDIETAGVDDENHAWNAIALRGLENGWVDHVAALHFGHAGVLVETGVQITVRDVRAVDPVALLDGGRMYNFDAAGAQQVLFTDCYARGGRHHYVSNGTTYTSGVVFHRSISEGAHAPSEGHRRWSTGLLYDNVSEVDPAEPGEVVLGLYNRGDHGTGHGWAAAHSVAWNYVLDGGLGIIQKPPTAQNYAIGGSGQFTGDTPPAPFAAPEGWIEGSGAPNLYPASLYEHQLGERLCPADAAAPEPDPGDDAAAHPFGAHHFAYVAGSLHPSGSPDSLDAATAEFYDAWKSAYLGSDCEPGQYYVKSGIDAGNLTVSEAHGYGMLLAAVMAGHDPSARAIFDGMVEYRRAHPAGEDASLMAWYQDLACSDAQGQSSASDGDLDMAFALLLADKQWGSCGAIDYRGEALAMLAAIAEHDLDASGRYVLLGSWVAPDMAKWYPATRSSDFMPDHLRSFAAVAGDAPWAELLDRTYLIIDAFQAQYSPNTGLLPDFVKNPLTSPAPVAAGFLESDLDGTYNYNACRDPWRLATDYLVSGDPRSRAAASAMSTWIADATAGDPTAVRAGYRLDGSPNAGSNYLSMAFLAPFGVAAMVDGQQQDWLDAIWASVVAAPSEGYYEDTIKLLSMLVMSGNWWAPEQASPICNP